MVLERRAADAASNTATGRWGTTAAEQALAVPDDELNELQSTLGKLHESYRALLNTFLKGLPEAANEVSLTVTTG